MTRRKIRVETILPRLLRGKDFGGELVYSVPVPIAIKSTSLRTNNLPFAIAGEAMMRPLDPFRATTTGSRPARTGAPRRFR